MKIDLSEIKKDYGAKASVSETFDVGEIEFMGETYLFPQPLSLKGSITNNTKSLHLEAKVTGTMQAHCARCMRPAEVPVSFRIDEILAEEDSVSESDEEDVVLYHGDHITLDELIVNSFLMHVPGRFLCREDCKGRCFRCGKDLNEGSCDCDTEEIDPRWAALAKIMKETSDTK